MRRHLITLVAVVTAGAFAGTANAGAGPAPEHEKRVVFVHGFELGEKNDCERTWGDMLDTFRDFGWTNTLVPVRYYARDTRCSSAGVREPLAPVNISDYGDHDKVGGDRSGHVRKDGEFVGHTADAPIKHLAYHFAWTVYDRYTQDGHDVEAVGHSMGGLIIRSAIHEVEAGNEDFPPQLFIEDVVTLGTPHTGVGARATLCSGFLGLAQCTDLRRRSRFLRDLADNAQNPQGEGGTEWTTIGAEDDGTVGEGSAIGMEAPDKIVYLADQDVGHGRYMHLKTGAAVDNLDAEVEVFHHGNFCEGFSALYWPIRLTDIALTQPVNDDCGSLD